MLLRHTPIRPVVGPEAQTDYMRSSKSRSRNKSNRQRTLGNVVNRVFDSSGPEGKVRGTPQQIIDKYLALARDAQLSSDRVAEQSFLQHAEHYTRMLGEAQREMAERQSQSGQRPEGDEQSRDRFEQRDDRREDHRRDDRRHDDAAQPDPVDAGTAPIGAFPPARDVGAETVAEALPEASTPETETEANEPRPKPARRAPRTAGPRPARTPRKPQVAEVPNGVASGD